MVEDAAVVVGALVHRLHSAIGVLLGAYLGVVFSCSCISARLKVKCRGYRDEHAGSEKIEVHCF